MTSANRGSGLESAQGQPAHAPVEAPNQLLNTRENPPVFHQPMFTGNASEYFRIWIVNLVLSIATLGVYSAWATVRNRRYFFGNTDIDEQRFDFHGNPVAILKGRVLAVALFLVYAFGTEFHWLISVTALAIMVLAFPWVLVRALRFRLANTSYRGLRFGFRGRAGDAYRLLAPILLAGGLVLGVYLWVLGQVDLEDPETLVKNYGIFFGSLILVLLVNLALTPVLWFRIRNFTTNNIWYGSQRFEANIRLGVFWKALSFAMAWFALSMIVFAVLITPISIIVIGTASDPQNAPTLLTAIIVVSYALMILLYLAPFAAWYCVTNNHVFSNTRVGPLPLTLELEGVHYWWILVSNAIVAVCTLGLAIPWAKVRMIRYKLSRLSLEGDLDTFHASVRQNPGAFGDELGEAFDLDFGF